MLALKPALAHLDAALLCQDSSDFILTSSDSVAGQDSNDSSALGSSKLKLHTYSQIILLPSSSGFSIGQGDKIESCPR